MRSRTMNTQFIAILFFVVVTFIGNAMLVSALNTETLRTTVQNESELFTSLLAESVSNQIPEEELEARLRGGLPENLASMERANGVMCWIAAPDGRVLMRLGNSETGGRPEATLYRLVPPDTLREVMAVGGGTRWLGRRNLFALREDCFVASPLYGGKLYLASVNQFAPIQSLQRRHLTLLLGTDILLTAFMVVLISNLVFKYRREILRYATTDELTGLSNRKSFNTAFQEFSAAGYGEASLFLLDIDFFKQINDNYGHAAGDHALRHLADSIQTMIRRTGGFAGRWGGDEFIGVLPLSGEAAQGALAELCREIESSRHADGFRMTISAGVTPVGQEARLSKLSEQADLALYQSKEGGRNQASLFRPNMESGADSPSTGASVLNAVEAAIVRAEEYVIPERADSIPEPAPELSAPATGLRFVDRIAGYVRENLISSAVLGVRWMAPFVAGGGILIGLAFLFDAASVDLNALSLETRAAFGSITPIAAALNTLGSATFNFMLPVFAGFMAYGLAGEDAFMAGFVGGYMTINSNSGFIGAVAAGLAAGVITRELRQFTARLPGVARKAAPIVVYPVFNLILMQMVSSVIITPVAAAIGRGFVGLLDAVGGNGVLSGALSAGMMATDMGGILNKAAYRYGVEGLASGRPDIMAAVMIGGMIPPLGIAASTFAFPGKYTERERERGAGTLFMGLSFITEGALPYVFTDVLRVIPCCVAGSALAGALSMLLGCTLPAPHGGLFVLPIIGHPARYVLCLAAGTALTASLLGLWKRPVSAREEERAEPEPQCRAEVFVGSGVLREKNRENEK